MVILLALVLLAGVVDLVRPGSFILAAWRRMNPPETPIERAVKDFKEGRPVTIPRSNRVDRPGSREIMGQAQASTPA